MRARELKAARKRLGLSQAGLAEALSIHRITVAVYESGRNPIPPMLALAMEALAARQAAQTPGRGRKGA